MRYPTSHPSVERNAKLSFFDPTMEKHGRNTHWKLLRMLYKKFYKRALMQMVKNFIVLVVWLVLLF